MARHKKIQAPEEDEPGLDISSLIDVCFLLLIYFLVTTQIIKKEQELSTALPSTTPSETPPDLAPMLILLEANGNISIKNETGVIELLESDSDARKLPNLSARLDLHKSAADMSSSKALVQIKVDGDAVSQRVTDVLNSLAGAKITEITFTDLLDPEAN
ncbi:biopolymer transporter ExbD [Akkermansiaceae bacterium]|jgi:biopolymer transport protein ExbD|nr:biopolymer transporter ExbD [Verrucomicrobiota bacterium]MCH1420037.1 biopolymer transporter ExbD [Akkermansiaceae bacterium]MDA7498009.1 biopolymer transporter ExbD [bacterium]MBT6165936.1 biopolymer transporter ExbD [Verrucomicrobiota bacterium]MBT6399696.1 biopolymer transporter ExbD [Verrucomicrobiota bacterium]|tara:strand:- start:2688 stop:3164 length:477 start_codon:yes stop_codon:yes gene_type:complete